MKVAVASGKGGTGKTMVTASLAVSWNSQVAAVDLDVEEPNLHFFMQPQIWGSREAFMDVPADAIINKIDLNSNNSREIQLFCRDTGLPLLAELPHDTIFVEALVKGLAITEFSDGSPSQEVRRAWGKILNFLTIKQAA